MASAGTEDAGACGDEKALPEGARTAGDGSAVSAPEMVRFETALPPGTEGYVPVEKRAPRPVPARTYPFALDPFQARAIACIDAGESVLVAAHTSAGKTVVAEYAIASALAARQRVVYTSPIKALSNQKYREFGDKFGGDVGLLTGDVTLNAGASVLVMTTEILRSMLYRGSEVMREVSWVVFDEIHYMRDRERGVVWEETLILLPRAVRHVFLSATIPNAREFADWVAATHGQPCHVVHTSFRPTPLQHYVCPAGADGLYLVVDERGTFREDNFARALGALKDASGGDRGAAGTIVLGESPSAGARAKRPRRADASSDIARIISLVVRRSLAPAIVFSFSKRDCESLAMAVGRTDLNSDDEQRLVCSVFSSALESLSPEDRSLPQIASMLPLLRCGIGIHHSGLLPILKEVVEILFQEGLIKILFATETFSIGLNMPARTVVFTSARKFDGTEARFLAPGEYVQMAGRAGRRGLDARGIVILMLAESLEPAAARRMLRGETDPLNSAFHLSHSMILGLMRVGEDATPEHMLSRSFRQFQTAAALPALKEEREAALRAAAAVSVPDEENVRGYAALLAERDALLERQRAAANRPEHAVPFMQPGRLVRVREGARDYGWCVVAGVSRRGGLNKRDASAEQKYVVDVLALVDRAAAGAHVGLPPPAAPERPAELAVLPAALCTLDGVSQARVYMPRDVRSHDGRAAVRRALAEVLRRFPDGPPLLDPAGDMGVSDPSFADAGRRLAALAASIFAHDLHRHPGRDAALRLLRERDAHLAHADDLSKRIDDVAAVVDMDELRARRRLLAALGYVEGAAGDVVSLKGRVACEISTGHEVLLTELLFSGAFNDLAPEVVAALLSCVVFEERVPGGASLPVDEPEEAAAAPGGDEHDVSAAPAAAPDGALRPELAAPLRVLAETARRVASASLEAGAPLDGDAKTPEAYVAALRPELAEVVHAWCRGARFARVCRMTSVFEGSIIRCMRRLEELLRQMGAAAHTMGAADLEAKFADATARLKRDIVFANSLYL